MFLESKARRKTLIALFILLLLLGGYLYWASTRSLPVVRPVGVLADTSGVEEGTPPNVSWSPYGEQAISVTGQSLSASYGKQVSLPTASIAKVMTALAILRKMPLQIGKQGPLMTISPNDVSIYEQELSENESVVQVSAGEQLSEYQLLQAMLVPSATNIADSAAVWAFGSISNYLAFANQYALQLGLTSTHFAVDASGFSPATVSTPQDLIRLGEAAMANPVVAQIVGQNNITLPVAGNLQNFDIDLGNTGIIGIKTGNTDQAGGAFLFAAKYNSLMIIGAIMGAPDLGTALHDAPEVISSFESGIRTDRPIVTNQVVAHYKVPWGGTVDAVARESATFIEWQGDSAHVATSLSPLGRPEGADTVVGKVQVSYRGKQMVVPVVLKESIRAPSIWWRLLHI